MPWPTDRDVPPGRVFVGTSGYVYPHWRRRFYPPGVPVRDWTPFYARCFGTVELNNPFYRLVGRGLRGLARRRPGRIHLRRQGQPVPDTHEACTSTSTTTPGGAFATPNGWYGS